MTVRWFSPPTRKVLGVRSKAEKCNKFHLVVEPLRRYYDTCMRIVEYSIAVVF